MGLKYLWTRQDDEELFAIIAKSKMSNGRICWEPVSKHMKRSKSACKKRYIRGGDLINERWSKENITTLKAFCETTKDGNLDPEDFVKVSTLIDGKTPSSCRNKWLKLKQGKSRYIRWTPDKKTELVLLGIDDFMSVYPNYSRGSCLRMWKILMEEKRDGGG